jgi:hypothetical protein
MRPRRPMPLRACVQASGRMSRLGLIGTFSLAIWTLRRDANLTRYGISCSFVRHKLTQHQGVYRVATLIVDYDDVPKHLLKTKKSPDGRKYFEIEAVVHISMQSSLEFFVTVGGKKYGSLTAQYE